MSKRIYGYCPSCENEIFNCDPSYFKNIRHVQCGKCNKSSRLNEIAVEIKETHEFDVFLTPYEALSELRKGTKLEYFHDDFWWNLYDDQPIYMMWKYKIRIK